MAIFKNDDLKDLCFLFMKKGGFGEKDSEELIVNFLGWK